MTARKSPMEKFPRPRPLSFRVVMTPAAAASPREPVLNPRLPCVPVHVRAYPPSASHAEPAQARSGDRLLRGLARASSYPFRGWCPPQSPIRIDYASELPRSLLARQELGKAEDAAGVLYGTRVA